MALVRILIPLRMTGDLYSVEVDQIWRVDDVPHSFPRYSVVRLHDGSQVETSMTKLQVRRAKDEAKAQAKANASIVERGRLQLQAEKVARSTMRIKGASSKTRSPFVSPNAKLERLVVKGTAADLALAKHLREVARSHIAACPVRASVGFLSGFAKGQGDADFRVFVVSMLREAADEIEKFNYRKGKTDAKRERIADGRSPDGADIKAG